MNYVIAIIGILLLLVAWLVVQSITRLYAQRHPEFGPWREEGSGCGESCSCTGNCPAKTNGKANRFASSRISNFAVAKHPLGGHRD